MRSTTCKREDVKRQNDVFLPLVLAERYALSVVRRKREVRCGLSYFYHDFLLLALYLRTNLNV